MRVTILLFVLLGVITLSYVRFMDPYQQNGPEILKNNWVISKTNKDSVQNEAGIISLYSADPKKKISVHQKVHRPGLSKFVKLEAEMMCENVEGTNKGYKALLFLVQYDGASKRLKTAPIAAMIDGTRRWQSYKKVFEVSPDATVFKVYAQLSRCTGTLQLKRVRLFPVKQIVFYSWIKTIMIGAWGLFFVFFLGSHPVKGRFWPQVLFFVICYGGILFAMTIPDDARNYLMKIMSIPDTLFEGTFAAGSGLELDEMGHILVFFLFGISICFLMPEVSFFVVGSTIFILAAGTELVQTLIDSRTPKIFDFYIDCFGGVMGVISAKILRVLRKIIF